MVTYRSNQSFDEDLVSDAHLFISRIQLTKNGFSWSLKGLDPYQSETMRQLEPFAVVTDFNGKVIYENAYNPRIQHMIQRGGLDDILWRRSGFGLATTEHGAVYRFISLEMPSGVDSTPAIMHVGRSTEGLQWVLNRYVVFYIYSIPFMLMISVAVGWFLSNRALRPFRDITKAAQQISSENLNTQIVTKYKEEEIQTLVRSFNAMVERLNRSFQQMRIFNADAAHELRTPLSILRGETELLLRSTNLTKEEIQSALKSNLEELDRLTRIINDMLMLSEAEAGEQVLAKEPVNLRALIENIVEQTKTLAASRNIQIELMGLSDVRIEGDKSLIQRAIFNVMDNAIKYSKDHGKVQVSEAIQNGIVRLEIRDFGIGITAADLPYIFDRLFRADRARSRNSGGSGLGLSMVKWIIEAHQGTIRVTSNPDQGTKCEIVLPTKPGIS